MIKNHYRNKMHLYQKRWCHNSYIMPTFDKITAEQTCDLDSEAQRKITHRKQSKNLKISAALKVAF
jgi:hypothetical protein